MNTHKLKVYLEQIHTVQSLTQEDWLDEYVEAPYLTKGMWLHYLEACAMKEAETLIEWNTNEKVS